MSSKKDGIMIVLSSPSGAGKTTLVQLLGKEKNYKISISYTTREPRSNEINGKDYYFIKKIFFKNFIKNKKFLEYAKVFKHLYGTMKSQVIATLEKGSNVIFDIDWQGTEQIKKKKLKYRLITFFILPPSKKELFQRLSNRDMKDKLIVEERMKEFSKDVLHWKKYDFVVINNDLVKCFKEIKSLIRSSINKKNNYYNKSLVKNHVKQLIV